MYLQSYKEVIPNFKGTNNYKHLNQLLLEVAQNSKSKVMLTDRDKAVLRDLEQDPRVFEIFFMADSGELSRQVKNNYSKVKKTGKDYF